MAESSNSAPPKVVIFSGGSAFNTTAAYLCKRNVKIGYIIPTTDNGGSSSEILRFFGGPSVGDFRNRLLRLARQDTAEACAVRALLEHRLGTNTSRAQQEWTQIINGNHSLWTKAITPCFRTTLMRFLQFFDDSVQSQQVRFPSLGPFVWCSGSVGNFFFTGARLFFKSLDAAIFWWSRVAQIPEYARVIPAVLDSVWDHTSTISSLTLGAVINTRNNSNNPNKPNNSDCSPIIMLGQSQISHPLVIPDNNPSNHPQLPPPALNNPNPTNNLDKPMAISPIPPSPRGMVRKAKSFPALSSMIGGLSSFSSSFAPKPSSGSNPERSMGDKGKGRGQGRLRSHSISGGYLDLEDLDSPGLILSPRSPETTHALKTSTGVDLIIPSNPNARITDLFFLPVTYEGSESAQSLDPKVSEQILVRSESESECSDLDVKDVKDFKGFRPLASGLGPGSESGITFSFTETPQPQLPFSSLVSSKSEKSSQNSSKSKISVSSNLTFPPNFPSNSNSPGKLSNDLPAVSPPLANPVALEQMSLAHALVYSMGSLYTSIIAGLMPKGFGGKIRNLKVKKILIINGCNDRETGGFKVSDYLYAIRDALDKDQGDNPNNPDNPSNRTYESYPVNRYITHVIISRYSTVPIDRDVLIDLGINLLQLDPHDSPAIAHNPNNPVDNPSSKPNKEVYTKYSPEQLGELLITLAQQSRLEKRLRPQILISDHVSEFKI